MKAESKFKDKLCDFSAQPFFLFFATWSSTSLIFYEAFEMMSAPLLSVQAIIVTRVKN